MPHSSFPKNLIDPLSQTSNPAIICKKVLLPEPDTPVKTVLSDNLIDKFENNGLSSAGKVFL